ncbi:hypothetical protein COW36_16605 [bacterium (Candidatus Blackallbacteria) CG17_big_fil_post_rev_8_21_14_2_50_48_46]|uniref:Uncharacterized protein n=1 Tax=bacterium (Candidatus Blackallbacteria) CG17_big_fil_post_rev_8_21_14_2_50_48_46 TaxID=2014261 RepID=A0A2M7G1G8_9BACT|nr:MAG: hypothetical protein COW64_08140 [bacterium (Candidatus Blackallbacteria) CG18_big_fil_WC_8_21_14_2_50_49_26]PIW15569.1 MAG: hypothetical protein COW36_16605 [bacterium (Candidatus Blackallbacteria) CG17_big_fil_post_rev_8_21_14_2_50_48_46]PIW49360.1 MAG: hypothetical protein COW20_06035 [bacterium (Candidatus Blackallbacteria) CG13_big_fil_rev_8_21_14_2_50_49_14]
MSWVSQKYDSFLQTLGLRKPPVTVAPPSPPAAAEEVKPHTLTQGENLRVEASNSGRRGTAQVSLGDSLQEQTQRWDQASQGHQIPEIQMAVKNGKSPTIALSEYLNKNGSLSREQRNQVANFMEQVMKYGTVKDSREQNFVGSNLIDVMKEGIRDKGITEEQVQLLANGDFTVQAYLGLVKDGQSIA